jgi:osmotically-inducible protein OsmY
MKRQSGYIVYLGIVAAFGSITAHADDAQDQAITAQVEAALQSHPDVGTQIAVQTQGGVVYLSGKTSTSLSKSNAEDLAKSVSGVQKVVDNIGLEK